MGLEAHAEAELDLAFAVVVGGVDVAGLTECGGVGFEAGEEGERGERACKGTRRDGS